MANGTDIIENVKALLKEERSISTKTALNLTLSLLLELHKAVKEAEVQMTSVNKRVEILERNSIMLWISRHPKLAVFIVTLFIVITTLVDLRVLVSKSLGLGL
jgi:hypothetical protein